MSVNIIERWLKYLQNTSKNTWLHNRKWSHKKATESEAIIKAERNEHHHCEEHPEICKNAFNKVKGKKL
jgi:hypothetical protein